MSDRGSGDIIPETLAPDDSVDDTCFVCLEGGDLKKSQCNCQILAHSKCLLKCVDRTGSLECTVCKSPFRNLYFETIITRHISPTLLMVLSSATVVIITGIGAGVVTTTDHTHWGKTVPLRDVLLLLFGFSIMGSLFSFYKFATRFMSEGRKCCTETRVLKARFIASAATRTRLSVSSRL